MSHAIRRSECDWHQDYDGVWETACGNMVEMVPCDPPSEHGWTHCPCCGRHIREFPYEEEEGE